MMLSHIGNEQLPAHVLDNAARSRRGTSITRSRTAMGDAAATALRDPRRNRLAKSAVEDCR